MTLGKIASVVVLLASFLDPAHGFERTVRDDLGPGDAELPRHSCYRVNYVPALYLVNTRGELVQAMKYPVGGLRHFMELRNPRL